MGSKITADRSSATREFYEKVGWRVRDGRPVDTELFGDKETGPIRSGLSDLREERVKAALRPDLGGLDLLECGCGGNPAVALLDICCHYTGTDFSPRGLDLARERLQDADVPTALIEADARELPFPDDRFDAVYSAHMLYHLDDSQAQETALKEMLRVVKPGGSIVLVTANPFPVLFPLGALRRVIATIPAVKQIANRLRSTPPLPYLPKRLAWFRAAVGDAGAVSITSHAVPSTTFSQRMSERRGIGKLLWNAVRHLERAQPKLASRLGSYAQVTIIKRG